MGTLWLYLDLSIAPDNVGANTYNTAIAVGEKAALIIAEDLYNCLTVRDNNN